MRKQSDWILLEQAYVQVHEGVADDMIIKAGRFLIKKLQEVNPKMFEELQQIVSNKDVQALDKIINQPQVQQAINYFSQPIEESVFGNAGKIIKRIFGYFNDTSQGASVALYIIGALNILASLYLKYTDDFAIRAGVETTDTLMTFFSAVGIVAIGLRPILKAHPYDNRPKENGKVKY